jgi:hypothetical protein
MCAKPKTTASGKQRERQRERQRAAGNSRAPKRDKAVDSASDTTAEESAIGGEAAEADTDRDARQFIRGLVIRGEAIESDESEGDQLPPGVTHRITKKDEQGLPIEVRRERYSAFWSCALNLRS